MSAGGPRSGFAGPATATEPSHDYPRIVVPPPGPRAREVVERDARFASSCYIKEYPLVVARGRGAMVEDVDGNRFLDFMAGIAVAATGHSHPRVVAAIQAAAEDFLHICGSDFHYPALADLCERLARVAPGPSPKRTFVTNSGTEAVEGAIKLARRATGRTDIIAFKGAFHGRTYGAMSLTCSKVKQRAGFGPFLPGVHHVPYGYCYRCDYGKTYPECALHCVRTLEEDLFSRELSPNDVAAIFVEPVQGEGGYVLPPPDWLPALRALCDRHGILLVADEIQSGIGRTGRMFAVEHSGVEPDILLTAKGLGSGMPIGAIIATEEATRWESGAHGSTFGGNPVCCAAALATLDLVEEGLADNAARMGERLLNGVRALQDDFAVIGDVRGLGLMVGVEFVRDRETRAPAPEIISALERAAFDRGLLILGCGRSSLRLAPPLVVDEEDVNTGLGILRQCLGEVA